ncbi:MAG TPA: FAD-binding oxidoreductase [Solirubrobacterales bacterium]|nr:FAD-binding oxidoreductase [Solirubrobacterales bacterium]
MTADAKAPGIAPRKWWGWGDPDKRVTLGQGARAMLRAELGDAEPDQRVAIEEVAIPAPRDLPPSLTEAVSAASVLTAHDQRVRRAAGSSYPDLVRLRHGDLGRAPDAVVMPGSAAQIAAVLDVCAREGIAVIPFGGGTSVVGGVDPEPGPHGAAISLDLRRLRSVEVDPVSMTATLGPGLRGPEAEDALGAQGFTIGHFPQSFEYATIGGFAATRSAGQASSGYGRFDEVVTHVAMTAPSGELRTLRTPHTAAGPSLRELIVGSEGTLGVITEVTVRVRPAPAVRRYEAWITADFGAGRELFRSLAQAEALPDVARLSDESETRVSLELAGTAGLKRTLLDAYLALRRRRGGCLVICGWEGESEAVERRRALSAKLLRSAGAVPLGRAPGRAWEHGRFEGPYLRDELLDLGYMVETLETSHTWARLDDLYRGVGTALAAAMAGQGTPGIVMCHVSHAYPDGASLYFTFACRARRGEELEQWRAVKTAACEAIVAAEGTITHHHAVGRDHAPYMRAEVGELGIEALRALKERLDPAGIMNPGKLLPAA